MKVHRSRAKSVHGEASFAWSYEDLLVYSGEIRGYIAFDPKHVTLELNLWKDDFKTKRHNE